jgi:hypothetical protein
MTMHQCPKCDLRFTWSTELDDHCRTDHPGFHHDYPVRGVHHNDVVAAVAAAEAAAAAVDAEAEVADDHLPPVRPDTASILATYWNER